ncbi:hypothetical protein D9M72_485680 [compost metagenome]
MADGSAGDIEHEGHLAAHHIRHRRRVALVRHVQHLHAVHLRQQFRRQVVGRAHARGTKRDALGVLARVIDQFADILRREVLVHQQHVGVVGDQADVGEVLDRVEVDRPLNQRGHGHGGTRDEVQRVAVGRCLGGYVGGDRAAGARAVVHHHRLLEHAAQLLGVDARGGVDRAARGIAHQQLDRPRRVGIARPGRALQQQGRGQGRQCGPGFHCCLLQVGLKCPGWRIEPAR